MNWKKGIYIGNDVIIIIQQFFNGVAILKRGTISVEENPRSGIGHEYIVRGHKDDNTVTLLHEDQ